jgi:hypothetical protein
MTADTISRRRLLARGLHASAGMVLAGTVGAGGRRAADPLVAAAIIPTFYDPRFPAARRRALLLPGRLLLRSIRGDPTAVLGLVSGARGTGLRRLQGVTTESIPFCLREFAGRGRGVRLDCRRVDRDLFVWTLTLAETPAVAREAST